MTDTRPIDTVETSDDRVVEPPMAIMPGSKSSASATALQRLIVDGKSFSGGKRYTVGTSSSIKFAINNLQSDKDLHIPLIIVSTSSEAYVDTWGGFTGITGGTEEKSYNRNKGALETTIADVFSNVTSFDGGTPTVVKESYIPGGSGPLALGSAGTPFTATRIIAGDGWAGLEITNPSASSAMTIGVEWEYHESDVLP